MRLFPVLVGLSLLVTPLAAAEVDAEDFFQLRARVLAQDEAIDSFRMAIQRLREEVARLKNENESLRSQMNAPRNYATPEQITRLTEQLREVDRNRSSDKQQILDAIDKLKAMPPVVVPPVADKPKASGGKTPDKTPEKPAVKDPPVKPAVDRPVTPELPTEFYEHTVGEGETLGVIIEAYNKEHGLKARLPQVLKANPEIKDPRRIRVGQKIRIPMVK